MTTWLKQLTLWDFNRLMFHAEKNLSKLSKFAVRELITEFKRRKMLHPDQRGGMAIYVPSFVLKKRMEEMFPEEDDGEFEYTIQDLKDLFSMEIDIEVLPKRIKTKKIKKDKTDYVKRLRNMTILPRKKRIREKDDLMKYLRMVNKIIDKMVRSDELRPFSDFIPKNTPKPVLNLVLFNVCHKIIVEELKVVSDDKGVINLYNSYVRGI